jgi:DNA-binding NarL/FixJ family response regulator
MVKTRILLADSPTFLRIILVNVLGMLGFEVSAVADNSKEALEKFVQYRPDIALIDLTLDETGGIDMVRELTKDNPSAAVALLIPENMDDPDVIIEAVRAGAKVYIKKPVSGEELKRRLGSMLERREGK